MKTIDLSVCADCIILIANGELPHDSDQTLDDLLLESTAGVIYDGADLGFSWEPCECCNRKLGGERYKALKITRQ